MRISRYPRGYPQNSFSILSQCYERGTLSPLSKVYVGCFNGILVYNKDYKSHMNHLQTAFALLQHQQVFVKQSKCIFGQQQLEYFVYIISHKGVSTDLKKKKSQYASLASTNKLKPLRGFLGLTGYYRRLLEIIAR